MRWLLRLGMRRGWYRGVLDGNRAWLVVGAVSLVGHLASRALRREEDIIWSGELEPGQVLTVRHEPSS